MSRPPTCAPPAIETSLECRDELNKENVSGTGAQANERYVRVEGCMRRYGYQA